MTRLPVRRGGWRFVASGVMETVMQSRAGSAPTLEESRARVAAAVMPLDPVRLPLSEALGCVLRQEACAPEDMPAFDRSAMDGYALRADDASARFRIAGEARPGTPPAFTLKPGECARIYTGAELPPGASEVLKQEDVQVADGWMTPGPRPGPDYIRRKGEDARAGDRLMAGGVRLGAAEIALLASLGIVEPLVSPRCRVAHFATGDELVAPAQHPGASQIRDSNSALVRAFVAERGAVMTHQERVGDDAALLTEHAGGAVETGCDLLLISGGASVGAYDFGRTALGRLGFEIRFEKLNLRPGKPLVFATRGRQAAFVLPGNPLAHLAVLHCIVRAAFDRFAGAEPVLRVADARLRAGIRTGGDGRDTLWPARVSFENGEPVVDPLRWRSSGDITGLAGLNAFMRCGAPVLDTGARVPCILLHG